MLIFARSYYEDDTTYKYTTYDDCYIYYKNTQGSRKTIKEIIIHFTSSTTGIIAGVIISTFIVQILLT